jgi:hypothetical protein
MMHEGYEGGRFMEEREEEGAHKKGKEECSWENGSDTAGREGGWR